MPAGIARLRALFGAALVAGLCAVVAPALADGGNGNAGPNVAQPPTHGAAAPTTPAPQGRSGQIELMDGALKLNVPPKYRYYSPEDAYAFLQRNNAASACTVLGMIAPADTRVDRPGAWATIVGYRDVGYVPASTSGGLTAPNFEADVRAARQGQNRPFEGFLVQPAFDANAASLTWAERAGAPGAGGKDLRYEQDKLGRAGVACMTSIGSADQMPAITAAAPDLMTMISFADGKRYTDYQSGSDSVSAYTVPALVTGVAPAPQAAAAPTPPPTQGGFAGLSGYFPWIAVGVVVLAILGFLLTRRRKSETSDEEAN